MQALIGLGILIASFILLLLIAVGYEGIAVWLGLFWLHEAKKASERREKWAKRMAGWREKEAL